MPITNRHFRSNLPPNLAKPNHQTDSVYKNNALGNVLSEIPYMDKDTTIQAIKCTIREINGGNNINHDHSDLDRLGSVIKDNTQIITANASSFFGMNKTRGAIIQLFSLCVHLAKLLDPPVHITYNPTRIEKAQLIRTVLLHPTVSGDGLIGLEDKNKLITEDLNVMFIRNRDGNIWDLELGNNSYLDHCHIEPNNNMRVGTANNHAAKGYYFNAATPRKLLSEALDTNNYSNTIKDKMLSCFDNRSSSLDLSNCGLTETPTKILSRFFPHLQELNLSGNRISEIKENAFARLNSLQKLELSSNQISEIKENAFAGLNSLHTLGLSENKISEIKENAFAGLNGLQRLDLFKNQISEIKENAFVRLNSLHTLELSSNKISEIKENAFAGLNSLHMLELSSNKISEIKENAFAGLNSLQRLNLSHNLISKIKENAFSSLLRAIFQNVHLKNTITNYSCIMYIKQSKIIEKYINNSSNAEVKQLCREYCLKLLLNNQLQEPEAIALLANEIHAGDIAIADVYPTKNLDWICKLLNNHNLVILPFLARNKSTFNSDEWQSVIINNNTQLVIPPPSTAIEDLLKNGLIQKFKSLGNDINGELLSNIVINPFTTGNDIIRQANNQIKGKITEILTSNQVFASEQQITNIMTQVRNKSFSIFIKKMSIKNILNHIDAILNIDAKAKDKLVDELIKINADSIQKDIVKTIYETLGIQYDDDHYTALEQFFDWPHAVREYTNTHFMEFADKTMADINQFKDQPEIYSNLILNCSPFLTYNCIKGILNTVPLEITQLCKEKLAVITQYAEVYGISDEDPIKVLFVSSNPNKVLEIEELSHLNPQSAELTLEKIHLIDLSDKNNPEKTQLNEREFNKIETSLPSWLSQSIKKQLTVANTVARVINKYFNKMITIDNINLSEDIKHKLTSIFYATSRNLGRDLNINFENKKSIMKALKDQPMENADIENDNINFFSRKFSQVVENCISRYRDARQDFEVLNMTDDELNTLPTKLIQELQSEPYLKAIEDMIKELETETIKYDSLKDIKTHEISLLLGIYFANLSSINGLGYHVDIDNRSFHRFRLYAAICLNQCVIFGSENLSADQKSGIQKEIRDLLLTAECSGQIANKLYGHYSLFGGLTERIKGILNTRMI